MRASRRRRAPQDGATSGDAGGGALTVPLGQVAGLNAAQPALAGAGAGLRREAGSGVAGSFGLARSGSGRAALQFTPHCCRDGRGGGAKEPGLPGSASPGRASTPIVCALRQTDHARADLLLDAPLGPVARGSGPCASRPVPCAVHGAPQARCARLPCHHAPRAARSCRAAHLGRGLAALLGLHRHRPGAGEDLHGGCRVERCRQWGEAAVRVECCAAATPT
jgi:hypothetical protein